MAARQGRGVGLSAFSNRSNLTSQYATHGAALRSSNIEGLQTQLAVFQSLLHNFAVQYAGTIKQNPTFRAEFARMCHALGVDPVAGRTSSSRGSASSSTKTSKVGALGTRWWSALAGRDLSDFYLDVAVRVVQVCRAMRGENGGLLALAECRERLRAGQAGIVGGGLAEVSEDDIRRAVASLAPLGTGFSIVEIGRRSMIRSVPKELNIDQATVLEAMQVMGYATASMLVDNLGWDAARAHTVLEDLLADSLVWEDGKTREKEYWSPSFYSGLEEG